MRKTTVLLVFTALFCGLGSLYADIMVRDSKANIIYQYSNGAMYEGPASKDKIIFRYDSRTGELRSRDNMTVFATWKNNSLYPKKNAAATPWYVYDNKKVHPKSTGNQAVAFIDGRKIYQGNGPGGKLVLYPDAPLELPVAIYLFRVATGDDKNSHDPSLKVDFSNVPYGYYLGAPKSGKIVLSLRGNKIFFNDSAKGEPAYTYKNQRFFKGSDITAEPAFCMSNDAAIYKGATIVPANQLMHLEWFNCYATGKSGKDAIGTLHFVGDTILTEGFTQPSQKPDFTGKRILLSSTLPNNKVDIAMRVFLVYLTQLDPDCRRYLDAQK